LEKYVSIWSECQAALKSLKAVRKLVSLSIIARRRWMHLYPEFRGGYVGFPDILDYEVMKSPLSLLGGVL
jgi:hypothetical protein